MVMKMRYRVYHGSPTTQSNITLVGPDDLDEIKIERIIIELNADLLDASLGTFTNVEMVLHVEPNGTSVVQALAAATEAWLGPVPEEEIWRHTIGFGAHSGADGSDFSASKKVYRDFKTSRVLHPGDQLTFSTKAPTLDQKIWLSGVITCIVSMK